ncbi:MAG TPA: hypothetical protein VNW92_22540 [Polyangiaceae bacterium]|nr:hypothetical protein [Polyangiaceae bacterium]
MRKFHSVLFLAGCVACGSRVIGSLDGAAGASNGGGGAVNGGGQNGGAGSQAVGGGTGGMNAGGTNTGGMNAGGTNAIAGSANGGSANTAGTSSAGNAGEAGALGEGGAAGSGPSGPPVKALMLIDSRLYAPLSKQIDAYLKAVEYRRGFAVQLVSELGLDQLGFADLRDKLKAASIANPELEGALFVGNLALPTFYKPRYDNLQTRLYPYYYEDLGATWMRAQDPGTTDPKCLDGVAAQENCNTYGNVTVPPHDYDRVAPGANGPGLWSAYWPVGVSGGTNDYAAFAAQLGPYLDKLLSFYGGQLKSNGKYYFVSNDPGWSKLELLWNATPRTQIDFYGKPGPQGQVGYNCVVPQTFENLCYVRWPLETYDSFDAFKTAYTALPFLGEGWQDPTIFSSHMNAALYEMVEVNVGYDDYGYSLVTTQQASQLTKAGLVIALDGSDVTGFGQPRTDCTVDIKDHLPSESVGVAYLYGQSQALAVLGDPTNRGHYANYPVLYSALKTGAVSYVGAAHLKQMQQNYADAGYKECVQNAGTNCGYALSENASEMLLGDPFLDFH